MLKNALEKGFLKSENWRLFTDTQSYFGRGESQRTSTSGTTRQSEVQSEAKDLNASKIGRYPEENDLIWLIR